MILDIQQHTFISRGQSTFGHVDQIVVLLLRCTRFSMCSNGPSLKTPVDRRLWKDMKKLYHTHMFAHQCGYLGVYIYTHISKHVCVQNMENWHTYKLGKWREHISKISLHEWMLWNILLDTTKWWHAICSLQRCSWKKYSNTAITLDLSDTQSEQQKRNQHLCLKCL